MDHNNFERPRYLYGRTGVSGPVKPGDSSSLIGTQENWSWDEEYYRHQLFPPTGATYVNAQNLRWQDAELERQARVEQEKYRWQRQRETDIQESRELQLLPHEAASGSQEVMTHSTHTKTRQPRRKDKGKRPETRSPPEKGRAHRDNRSNPGGPRDHQSSRSVQSRSRTTQKDCTSTEDVYIERSPPPSQEKRSRHRSIRQGSHNSKARYFAAVPNWDSLPTSNPQDYYHETQFVPPSDGQGFSAATHRTNSQDPIAIVEEADSDGEGAQDGPSATPETRLLLEGPLPEAPPASDGDYSPTELSVGLQNMSLQETEGSSPILHSMPSTQLDTSSRYNDPYEQLVHARRAMGMGNGNPWGNSSGAHSSGPSLERAITDYHMRQAEMSAPNKAFLRDWEAKYR